MGLCNVYRRFIRDYTTAARPLYDLLKGVLPKQLPEFSTEQMVAFKGLLEKLSNPPILALPQPLLPYEVHTDASAYQVGCSLFQIYPDRSRRPVGFWSRTLNSAEKNYSPTERECLAVIYSITTCRPYLYGQRFTVVTDHHSLRWLLEINDPASGRLMRWRIRLAEFDFDIGYRKGSQHMQPDALSRLPSSGHTTEHADLDIPCLSLSLSSDRQILDEQSNSDEEEGSDIELYITPSSSSTAHPTRNPLPPPLAPVTIEELFKAQQEDTFCQQIAEELRQNPKMPFGRDEASGLLIRTRNPSPQVVAPDQLRSRLLALAHKPLISGHPGGRRMYQQLRRNFYWPAMSAACYEVARNCYACAAERVKLHKAVTRLKLFPAVAPLESVALDLLGPLLRTQRGNLHLLVITDRFTKLTVTVPMSRITAWELAHAFTRHWVFVYGPPKSLLTDNGRQMASKFFTHICQIIGIKNIFTTTYHPQANGQAERFNRTIVSALRKYIGDHPTDWDLFTPALTFAYNRQPHTSTGLAPFDLVVSRPIPPLLSEALSQEPDTTPKKARLLWAKRLEAHVRTATAALHRAQARYKAHYDSRIRQPRSPPTIGGYVFVRREIATPSEHGQHKLAPVADGPFQVIEVTDKTVVIQRQLATETISRDRVVIAPSPQAQSTPQGSPHNNPSRSGEYVVDRIISHKPASVSDAPSAFRYRVRWYNYGEEQDTWEPTANLPAHFILRYTRRHGLPRPHDITAART